MVPFKEVFPCCHEKPLQIWKIAPRRSLNLRSDSAGSGSLDTSLNGVEFGKVALDDFWDIVQLPGYDG